MKPVILLPDGVGVRNFLLGPFLRLLSESATPHVFHAIPVDSLETYKHGLNGNVHWASMLTYRENVLVEFLRYSATYAHFFHWDTQGMRYMRALPVGGRLRRRVGRRFSKYVGRSLATVPGIAFLEKWQHRFAAKAPEVRHYLSMFRELAPTVLFCSHQRPPAVVPAVLAARALRIPTATFIFSWDNLSSKSRVVAPFDHFLVWSRLMKEEMGQYYPEISPDRVHIVGTPQFDPYSDSTLRMARDEFFHWLGADPARPLICFSGSDIITAPDDQHYVEIVMEEIRAGHILRNPQVLLRPAPVDSGERFAGVRRRFPELIYRPADWIHCRNGNWSGIMPLPADIKTLVNLTRHSDLNLNVSSTMTLDFALRDKPVVNIAFDVTQPPPFGVPIWEFHFQFEHYVPVIQLGAARFARTRQELIEHVNAYLENPSLDCEARRRFAELEVGVPVGSASRRIIETLERLSIENAHLLSLQ